MSRSRVYDDVGGHHGGGGGGLGVQSQRQKSKKAWRAQRMKDRADNVTQKLSDELGMRYYRKGRCRYHDHTISSSRLVEPLPSSSPEAPRLARHALLPQRYCISSRSIDSSVTHQRHTLVITCTGLAYIHYVLITYVRLSVILTTCCWRCYARCSSDNTILGVLLIITVTTMTRLSLRRAVQEPGQGPGAQARALRIQVHLRARAGEEQDHACCDYHYYCCPSHQVSTDWLSVAVPCRAADRAGARRAEAAPAGRHHRASSRQVREATYHHGCYVTVRPDGVTWCAGRAGGRPCVVQSDDATLATEMMRRWRLAAPGRMDV